MTHKWTPLSYNFHVIADWKRACGTYKPLKVLNPCRWQKCTDPTIRNKIQWVFFNTLQQNFSYSCFGSNYASIWLIHLSSRIRVISWLDFNWVLILCVWLKTKLKLKRVKTWNLLEKIYYYGSYFAPLEILYIFKGKKNLISI